MSTRESCKWCTRPIATDADYESIAEGEGRHLCWSEFGNDPDCDGVDGAEDIITDLRAQLAAVTAERDALRARVPRWVSVKERLPEPSGGSKDYEHGCSDRVLIWNPFLADGPVISFFWYKERAWCDDESMGPLPLRCQATHWMAMPPPPATDETKGTT